MTANRIAVALIAAWAVMFAASFAHFHLAAPVGEGAFRGANRVAVFLGWHLAAIVPAFSALVLASRHGPALRPAVRRVAYLPLVVSGLAWATVAGAVIWVRYSG